MKTIKISAVVALLALALAGCVTQPPRKTLLTAEDTAAAVQVSRDDFKKVTHFTGTGIGDGSDEVLFLRAWKADGMPTRYQVYVADFYRSEWRFYESAHDIDGNTLDVTLIDRKVGACSRYSGCSHHEHLAINISREYLEQRVPSGMSFQISGKGGKEVFFVPGFHIAGFLASTQK